MAGGSAGAIARTTTAPLERIKLLFQVQAVPSSGERAGAYTSVRQAWLRIYREEGFRAFWKGNGANVVRIFPYTAVQMAANDQYKRFAAPDQESLLVAQRLAAGASAGVTATLVTHPLDVVRLRMSLQGRAYPGIWPTMSKMVRTEGALSLYKGLSPAIVGIAPYAAITFSCYDLLKQQFYADREQSAPGNLAMGGLSGTVAATICYPLDTIRRRMQMAGTLYSGQMNAFLKIWQREGLLGFYCGYAANSLKIIPSSGIRFVTYEWCKQMYGVAKSSTDT